MSEDDLRRVLPPPRRPPGPVGLCVRWRAEMAAAACVAAAWYAFGGWAVAMSGLVLATVLALSRWARHVALGLLQAVIVPHRVRAGLVQAGVADRDGRLPWLVAARPRGDSVHVTVWLRAGTTLRDLVRAAPLIAAACGAVTVEVERYSVRQDRAMLVVARPRWGWWTK